MAEVFFTEEQRKVRQTYKEFVATEIIPRAREIDEKNSMPKDLLGKLTSPPFNVSALSIPKEYGGLGLGQVEVGIIAEEIAYACPAVVTLLEIGNLYSHVLLHAGTEEQKKKFLGRIAGGELGCYALTDEGPGSDPAAMGTTAVRDGESYIINGRKRLISFADIAKLCATFARTDHGVTAFIIERDSPGFKLEKHSDLFGLRGHRAYNIRLQDVRAPQENVIGEEGAGLRIALRVLNTTRISLSWAYVGLARAAFDIGVKFSKERIVGGKPIAANQAIAFPLAELATEIDAARLLAYRAAVMSDKGIRHRKETSMAKMYAGEVLLKAVALANRIHGGYGGDKDYPVERYVRDAFSWIPAHGTTEVQRVIVAREILQPGD